MARSRLSTSSSSTNRSLLRVTRNCQAPSTFMPLNSCATNVEMTADRNTKCVLPGASSVCGRRMMRGSERGTCTTASSASRPNASLPDRRTMKFRLLF